MFENGFLIPRHVSSCLWVGALHILYWFAWDFGCQKIKKWTEKKWGGGQQPETVDGHKLQQSTYEIYEPDWGFTVWNQVCMVALNAYKNDCFL